MPRPLHQPHAMDAGSRARRNHTRSIQMNAVSPTLCVALLFGILAACGEGPAPVAHEDFDYEICVARTACGYYPSIESCMATVKTNKRAEIIASVAAGRVDYHADKARACIDARTGSSNCEINFDWERIVAVQATCAEVWTGRVEVGGACLRELECANGAKCELPDCQDECCVGTCVAPEPRPESVAVGGDCSEAPCNASGHCVETGQESRCVAYPAEGEPCTDLGFAYCAAGLLCIGVERTCTRPPATGERCDPDLRDPSLRCLRSDDWCDWRDERCKPRTEAGESCAYALEQCALYAYCDPDTGYCVRKPVEGEWCSDRQPVSCMEGHRCNWETCVLDEPRPVCTI